MLSRIASSYPSYACEELIALRRLFILRKKNGKQKTTIEARTDLSREPCNCRNRSSNYSYCEKAFSDPKSES